MKSRVLLMTLVSAMLCLTYGCSSMKVNAEYDLEHDFSTAKTYTWNNGPYSAFDPLRADIDIRNRLINAVDTVLQEKGFEYIQEGEGDFIVAIRGDMESQISGSRGGYRYRAMSGGGISGNNYKTGSLTIDIINPDTNTVIWRGIGTKTLSETKNEKKQNTNSLNAVKRILKTFPPKS